MTTVIPPSQPYPGVLQPLPGRWNETPAEGDKQIGLTLAWSVPENKWFYINLQNSTVLPISQLVALAVDNSQSAADVKFIFPDTGFTLSVPAYGGGVFPVFTNAVSFYAGAPMGSADDVTTVIALNSMPPPVSVQPTLEQTQSVVAGVNLAVNGATQVVASAISGTVEAFSVVVAITGGGAGETAVLTLQDGSTPEVVLWGAPIAVAAGQTVTMQFGLTGIRSRFLDGLSLHVASSTLAAGSASVSVYYGTPA